MCRLQQIVADGGAVVNGGHTPPQRVKLPFEPVRLAVREVGGMKVVVSDGKQELGRHAARHGAEIIRQVIQDTGEATIVVATGASQFEMLAELVAVPDIEWDKV